jgi:hypothetical protein
MSTLANVRNYAISRLRESLDKTNIKKDLKSSGGGEAPRSQSSLMFKGLLDDLQDLFVYAVIWISTISVIAPIFEEAIRKLIEVFQTPVARI